MDHLDGYVDLFDYISKTGPLTEPDTKHVISQLVQTTCYLFFSKVDHRDIKDENLLYNPLTKQIKLIDFGSASRLPAPGIRYTKFQGTEVYVPPEYYRHGSYSPLFAATWAIGCLTFVLLNGNIPFANKEAVKGHREVKFLRTDLGKEAQKFIRDLLVEEERRMSPAEILQHPWIRQ